MYAIYVHFQFEESNTLFSCSKMFAKLKTILTHFDLILTHFQIFPMNNFLEKNWTFLYKKNGALASNSYKIVSVWSLTNTYSTNFKD